MKQLFTIVISFSLYFSVMAQNLVINPSFELTSSNCANFGGEGYTTDLLNWDLAATPGSDSCSTPDLFSACNILFGSPTPFGLPQNAIGYQFAHTGSRYVGLITYGPVDEWREYIQGRLNTPLVAGQIYCVSFYVSLADFVPYASNNIGVRFSPSHYVRNPCPGTTNSGIYLTPQLNYGCGVITDTTENWVRLQWSYTATGGEQYFIIGNFFNNAGTAMTNTGQPTLPNPFAYYYIDDVSVVPNTCCYAKITPHAPFCINDAATNLVVTTGTGSSCTPVLNGTWSGTGITNATNGTFSPSVAGAGSHLIKYTLPCGYIDSTTIVVNTCSATSVCKETNGKLTVSGGTAPYTWSYWQYATNTTVTNAATCTACGGTWNAFVMQCLNGFTPVNSCTTPAGWAQFGTGVSVTPPAGKDSIKVVDNSGTAVTVYGIATLPSCSFCPTLTITPANQVNVKCFGQFTGSFSVTTTGGASPYNYVLKNGATTVATFNAVAGSQPFTGLPAGTYTLNVTDANACPGTATITITQPAVLAVSTTPTATTCGLNNGSATTTVTGGTTAYTYVWNNGGGSASGLTNVAANTYIVTVTDANTCTATASAVINTSTPITTTTSATATTCGLANGTATANVTAGTGPFSYVWSNAQTSNPAINLSANSYTVTVTGLGGCTATATTNVNASSAPNITAVSKTDETCLGQGNGSINSATTTGGTGTLQYGYALASNPLAVTPIAAFPVTNVAAGTYIVGVQDASGCRDTFYITLNPGPNCCGLAFKNITLAQPGCTTPSGSIDILMTNGTPPYIYTWSANAATGNSPTASNLSSGTYGVTVQAGLNCVRDTSITLTAPNAPNITAVNTTAPTCSVFTDGSLVSATTTGGTGTLQYGYALSTNPLAITPIVTFPVSNLAAGTYILGVQDANSCRDTFWFTIAPGPNCCNHTLSGVVTQPTCTGNNGAIDLSVANGSGQFTYLWSTTAMTQDVSSLNAATYSVTVTDTIYKCTKDTSFVLAAPNSPNINSIVATNETCLGQADGSLTASNTTGGTGTLQYGYAISSNPLAITPIVTFPVSNLAAGTYILGVQDANNCRDTFWFTIVAGPKCCTLSLSAILTQPTCGNANGGIDVTVTKGSGNYQYTWNGTLQSQDTSNASAGNYTLHLEDITQACTIDTTFALNNSNGPQITSNNKTDESCSGKNDGTATIVATGTNVTFAWSNGLPAQATQSGLSPNTYTFTITDGNNCKAFGSVTIAVGGNCCNLQSSTSNTPTTCGKDNGSITVTIAQGTAPYSYSIDNGTTYGSNNLFQNLASATYSVIARDANCADTFQVTVATSTAISFTQNATDISCNGKQDGTISITVTNGAAPLNYVWSNSLPNQATQSGLAANNYTVTISDGNSCTASASATIIEPAPLTVSMGVDTIQCGGTITLVAQTSVNPVQYNWSTGESTASITVSSSNTYSVTVTAGVNCTATDDAKVTIYTQPQIELGQDTFMYANQSIQLNGTATGGSGTGTYLWTPYSFLTCNNCPTPKAIPTDKTTFYVVYTDSKGCVVSDSITINVLDDGNLEMPNAFTPNGDGKNDEFKAIYRSVKEFKMSIFNRWGELVFQSFDVDKGWDGVYKGELQPPGVYVYYVNATFYNNKSVSKQGSLTLIR